MTSQSRKTEELLELVARDRLDELTPDEVTRLEAVADADPRVEARLAGLAAGGRALADAPLPSTAQWEQVWQAIDAARPASKRRARFWFSPVAIAAAIAMFVVWSFPWSHGHEVGWALRLDANAEIVELETFGGELPFVVSAGDNGGFPVIWVMDESEGV